MSAGLLRRAAALMRERADAAIPPPWLAEGVGGIRMDGQRDGYQVMSPPNRIARCQYGNWNGRENAEHIASWHPAVALAVADWLDNEALVWDRVGPSAGVAATAPAYALPVAVASAYLGERP